MIVFPHSRAVFRSGLPVAALDSNLQGTLGPIVADLTGQLFALTLTTFVPHGKKARARTPSREMRFAGPAIALAHPTPPFEPSVTTLLSLLPIDAQAAVDPLLASVEAPSRTASALDHSRERLILGRPTGRVELGRALSLGEVVQVDSPDGGEGILLGGAIRIDCSSLSSPIAPGEAGTAVLSPAGDLIGILIGVGDSAAFAAPVHKILAHNNLLPMTRAHLMAREAERAAQARARSAQRAQQQMQQQEEITFTPARIPSEQTFAESALAGLVHTLEPAW